MIIAAKEEDLKKIGRRGFLRMFGTTAASAVVAPTKTFAFFGNILRPRSPVIPVLPGLPEGIVFKPEWLIAGAAVFIGSLGLKLSGLSDPNALQGMLEKFKIEVKV